MHKDDFTSGIERIEKLFGQEQNVYDEATLTEIYNVVRHLDAGLWEKVVGIVIRGWPYKTLPSISAFDNAKDALGPEGQRRRKIQQDCPTCGGHGLRGFIYRDGERFRDGVCLCDCPNAENFTAPPHMSFERASKLPGFKPADRPGDVGHMLEALNPRAPQEARDGTEGPGAGEHPAAPTTQPGNRAHKEASTTPGTLVDTAAELAGKLDASQKPREQRTEERDRQKRDKMLQDLNDWLSDDEKEQAPF